MLSKNKRIVGNILILIWLLLSISMFATFQAGDDVLPFAFLLALCSYSPLCWVNSWGLVIGPVDLNAGEHDNARLLVFIGSLVALILFPIIAVFRVS